MIDEETLARTATKVVAKSSSPIVFSATQMARYCELRESESVGAQSGDEELGELSRGEEEKGKKDDGEGGGGARHQRRQNELCEEHAEVAADVDAADGVRRHVELLLQQDDLCLSGATEAPSPRRSPCSASPRTADTPGTAAVRSSSGRARRSSDCSRGETGRCRCCRGTGVAA